MTPESTIIEAWCRALHVFYALARGERLGELNGRRSRLIDERGLHPLSVEVGRVMALQELIPELEELEFNHMKLRRAAQHEAELQYELETAIEVGLRYKWISTTQADAIRLNQGPELVAVASRH